MLTTNRAVSVIVIVTYQELLTVILPSLHSPNQMQVEMTVYLAHDNVSLLQFYFICHRNTNHRLS